MANTPALQAKQDTFEALSAAWQASSAWRELKPRTQTEWTRHCRKILERYGPLEVRGLEPKHILKWQDEMSDHPADANNTLRCLSSMLSWSVPRDFRSDNPCREIKRLKIGDGYPPWPWDAVEAAERALRPDLWRGAALALYTGQRLSDVLSIRRNRIYGSEIEVKQDKTGKELVIPIHKDLRPIIDGINHNAVTILANTRGQPWTPSGFKSAWRKGKPAFLADQGLVFHGLRKTAVVTLLEVGCSDEMVAAITGQSRRMIVHYGKKVASRKLARRAMDLWEQEQNVN